MKEINGEEFNKAFELWDNFKTQLLYENRYIVKHEVLDYLKQLAISFRKTIEKDTILYRARIFTKDHAFISYQDNNIDEEKVSLIRQLEESRRKAEINRKNETGFWGYDAKGSFVPDDANLITDGRANPSFIKYLYTSEKPYTAMVEVRPYLNSKVSVAKIKVKEQFSVADFSYESFGKVEGIMQNLAYLIMADFAEPSNYDKKSYIPTQYIAEFIKTLEYDGIKFEGIRFNSSLHKAGRNITIFSYSKCESVGSKLYEINDICLEAKGLAPENEPPIIHEKLVKIPMLLPKI